MTMIRDLLDVLNPRPRFTAAGVLFDGRPEVDGGGEPFNYEYINPYSSTYRRLYANIQGDSGEVAIRTNDLIRPEINKSHIKLADGKLYCVLQVDVDYQTSEKEAQRLFAVPLGTQIVMRLVPVDNPWGL